MVDQHYIPIQLQTIVLSIRQMTKQCGLDLISKLPTDAALYWQPTTSKPNVAYYYRIEDVDFAGTRTTLKTYQLRGVIVPVGKDITIWGTLKDNR